MFSEGGTMNFHPEVLGTLNLGVVFVFLSAIMRVSYESANQRCAGRVENCTSSERVLDRKFSTIFVVVTDFRSRRQIRRNQENTGNGDFSYV